MTNNWWVQIADWQGGKERHMENRSATLLGCMSINATLHAPLMKCKSEAPSRWDLGKLGKRALVARNWNTWTCARTGRWQLPAAFPSTQHTTAFFAPRARSPENPHSTKSRSR